MAGRSQESGSAMHDAAALIALALLAAIHGSMAATYTVGGTQGWNIGVSYSAWAAKYTFKVGDTLNFNYNAEMHSVFQVNEAGFKACNMFPAINKYQSGSDSITLTQPTTYYFVCGTPGHCSQGMALEVTIGGSNQTTPSPAPVVAPVPTAPAPASAPLSAPSLAPKKAPAPAPVKVSPSPSPNSPSPSEAISPTEATSPSSSSHTSPSSGAPAPSEQKSSASTLQSGAASLLSAALLGGFLLYF